MNERNFVGFDVGNAKCVIASIVDGKMDVVLNDESKRETPSVICFGEKQRFLGCNGAAFASKYPKSTFSDIKNRLALDKPPVTVDGYLSQTHKFNPTELMAMMFTNLKQTAERKLKSEVTDCVIGIPSYFKEKHRRAYLNAAKIAGLNRLRLLHDCTAAALSYGFYKTEPAIVAFVDIGHCDTQVSIASFKSEEMSILSHSSDPSLGGRDFDDVLINHFKEDFKNKYGIDVPSDCKSYKRLKSACEKMKTVLSVNSETSFNIECFHGEMDVEGKMEREKFEHLCRELLWRIAIPCAKAAANAGVPLSRIDSVELIGSGSRVPSISKVVHAVFNKEPSRTVSASECVAMGCALQCRMLNSSNLGRKYAVKDIFPYSISVSSIGEVFGRKQHLPITKDLTFKEMCPFSLHIMYGNPADQEKVKTITVKVEDSKASKAGETSFDLKFELDLNGIVNVCPNVSMEDGNNDENLPMDPKSLAPLTSNDGSS